MTGSSSFPFRGGGPGGGPGGPPEGGCGASPEGGFGGSPEGGFGGSPEGRAGGWPEGGTGGSPEGGFGGPTEGPDGGLTGGPEGGLNGGPEGGVGGEAPHSHPTLTACLAGGIAGLGPTAEFCGRLQAMRYTPAPVRRMPRAMLSSTIRGVSSLPAGSEQSVAALPKPKPELSPDSAPPAES